jgi:hypothetical protein
MNEPSNDKHAAARALAPGGNIAVANYEFSGHPYHMHGVCRKLMAANNMRGADSM